MTRKIKFRVWDKLEKRFIYPDKGYQGHYVLSLDGKFQNLQNGSGGDECVVQQYTGIKDSEQVDIYEGDVIEFERKDERCIAHIFYHDAFVVTGNSEEGTFVYAYLHDLVNYIYKMKIKVIGNTFELPCNPDHNGECLVCDNWLCDCPLNKKNE